MRFIPVPRLAPGTLFGLAAIVIASVGSISAIRASSRTPDSSVGADSPAPVGSTFTLVEHPFTLAHAQTEVFKVKCPAGNKVVSGGYRITSGNVMVPHNYPMSDASGWVVALVNNPRLVIEDSDGEIYAICAKKGAMRR